MNINTSKFAPYCVGMNFPVGFSQSWIECPRAEPLGLDFRAEIQLSAQMLPVSSGTASL